MSSATRSSLAWIETLVSEFAAGSARGIAARDKAARDRERLRGKITAGATAYLDEIASRFNEAARQFPGSISHLDMRREPNAGAILINTSCEYVAVRLDAVPDKALGVFVAISLHTNGGGRRYFSFVESEDGDVALAIDGQTVGPAEAARLAAEPFLRVLCLRSSAS